MSQQLAGFVLLTFGLVVARGEFVNLAKGKPTMSSSTSVYRHANLVAFSNLSVDGNTNADFVEGRSCFSTAYHDYRPYWVVDLEGQYSISSVKITNRGDCCADRLRDISVYVYENVPFPGKGAPVLCGKIVKGVTTGAVATVTCPKDVIGRYVWIAKDNVRTRDGVLTLCEVEVMGDNSPHDSDAFMVEIGNVLDREELEVPPIPDYIKDLVLDASKHE